MGCRSRVKRLHFREWSTDSSCKSVFSEGVGYCFEFMAFLEFNLEFGGRGVEKGSKVKSRSIYLIFSGLRV